MRPLLLAFGFGFALSACHEGSVPREQRPAVAGPVGQAQLSAHAAPLKLTLLGPAQVVAGQDLELSLEIEQFSGSEAAQLHLDLPSGLTLLSGEQSEQLPPGNGKLVRHYRVHVTRVPERDIEAVASVQGRSFGARALSAYRFGRPEPRFAEPPRARPVSVSGRDLGQPIQLKTKEQGVAQP